MKNDRYNINLIQKLSVTLFVTGCLLFQTCEALSQVIRGRVLDELTREPVKETVVTLQNSQQEYYVKRTATAATGYFKIEIPKEGEYYIHVRRIGYTENSGGPYYIGRGDTLNIEMRVLLESVLMDEITIEAEPLSENLLRNQFYLRRKRGIGHFMTRKEIEEKMAPRPSKLFIDVHGVTIRNDGHLISSRHHNNCLMTIVLNGVVMVQEKSLFSGDEKYKLQPTIDELVHVDNIEAIEVYRGHIGQPLQYTGVRTPCGAILIWTRL